MAARKVLLVEGPDDEHTLKHLCHKRGVPALDSIKSLGGVNSLLDGFPVRLKESDIEALGVVIDADTDLAGRWHGLRDRLIKAGYGKVPANPVSTGTILQPPPDTLLPRVGVWIMPDNQSTGILEDFLRFLIPAGSRLFEHVQSSIASIPEGERRFSDLAEPKAVIHTWLAWQAEPRNPFGTAISKRDVDPGVPEVDVLVAWLKALFFP